MNWSEHDVPRNFSLIQFKNYVLAVTLQKRRTRSSWELLVQKGDREGYQVVFEPNTPQMVRMEVREGCWKVRDAVEELLASNKQFSAKLDTEFSRVLLQGFPKCILLQIERGAITNFRIVD